MRIPRVGWLSGIRARVVRTSEGPTHLEIMSPHIEVLHSMADLLQNILILLELSPDDRLTRQPFLLTRFELPVLST